MKISASVFASDEPVKYAEYLKIAEIDYLHLDFIETEFLDLDEINNFNRLNKPLDVHLICSKVTESTVDKLNNSSTEILSVQYETLINIEETIKNLQLFKKNFGFAILPTSNSKVLLPYKNKMDHILIMCSKPGISGAKFLEDSYKFIEEIKEQFPETAIYVDGGMNDKICEVMCRKGASIAVFGSYLYKNRNNLRETVNILKNKEKVLI